jgi:hypothetical protein
MTVVNSKQYLVPATFFLDVVRPDQDQIKYAVPTSEEEVEIVVGEIW